MKEKLTSDNKSLPFEEVGGASKYTEDSIRTLEWNEHIRLRPGMYIGKLGDGSSPDDGIYILLKETIDNCIDEFVMGNGRSIDISITPRYRQLTSMQPIEREGLSC